MRPEAGSIVVVGLGRGEAAEALSVPVFLDIVHGGPVGEILDEFDQEGAGLGAQGDGRASLIRAVKPFQGLQEVIPSEGGGEAEQGMFRIENELGEGQIGQMGLRVLGNVHG